MRIDVHSSLKDGARGSFDGEPKELVMGLHWDPPRDGERPANLDALCVLLDGQDQVLEIVHPAHPRNESGSVLHTGDSPTGASEWDDERIFVFLEALPETVSTLAFVVASADGRPFGDVPGASCHVSDRATEHEWLRLDLTALGSHTTHCIATLQRSSTGWNIVEGAQTLDAETLAGALAGRGKEIGAAGQTKRHE